MVTILIDASHPVQAYTLDTNCLLAVDEQRPEAGAVSELVAAHRQGRISVAVVAISASERQKNHRPLENFAEFEARLQQLGLAGLDIIEPLAYWDVTFWDCSIWGDEAGDTLERAIHEILFPNLPFLWEDCAKLIEAGQDKAKLENAWRNAKCDVLAYWSHVHHKREVFVTSDGNFHTATKRPLLLALGGSAIETPKTAAARVSPVAG